MNNKKTSELYPLTSLRFFLATWIVLYHRAVSAPLGGLFGVELPKLLYNPIHTGFAAVGLFFVLSGFVLALNYPLDRAWNSRLNARFAMARFSRIYPVYLLSLVVISPLILHPLFEHYSHALLVRRSGSGILNLLMLQAWVPRAAVTWNGPGWSLSAEAFFYLCFPWIGKLIFRLPSIGQSVFAVFGLWLLQISLPALCVIMRIPGIGTAVATSNLETTIASVLKYNPLLQLPFFLAGIVCCRLFLLLKTRNSPLFGHGYLVYLPSFALLAAMLVNADRIPYALLADGLTLIPAAGAVLGLAFGDSFCSRVLSASWLVFLGKASYAEYLLHFPVRAAFDAKLGYVWSPLTEVAYLVAVLVVSATVYQFYEEPTQRRLRSWIHIPAPAKELRVAPSAPPVTAAELALPQIEYNPESL